MDSFVWPSVGEFIDREAELRVLERWWDDPDPMPLSLYGRRRCGKSWLFRRFAHGKPAVVLVARRTAPGAQLNDLAERLEPLLGVRPVLNSLVDLFRVLYRAARDAKILVVIDEFPYLLPTTEAETDRELTAIAAVMEDERENAELKLLLCGSLVGQMESLLVERGPLHGRLQPLRLDAVAFTEARLFLPDLDPIEAFTRFSIAGGMPRYLRALAAQQPLVDLVCDRILNPHAGLWDEGRAVLEQELREPKVYFAVLQALSSGDKDSAEIVNALRSDAQRVSKYLRVLESMRLVGRRLPVGAPDTSRSGHWHLREPFLRFWFRFVFPFQDDLESGLDGRSLYTTEVEPVLNDHVAPEFEEFARHWVRAHHAVTQVGAWWGLSRHDQRRLGERSSEEIDIVGLSRGRVTLIGECRWRTRPMDRSYLADIEDYKLPALRQSELTVVNSPKILLLSRGGYTDDLVAVAANREDLVLIDVATALAGSGG